jgi:hypothetical protein
MSSGNILHVAEQAAETTIWYRQMPPEPWGRKLKRARWDLNHYTINEAVTLAGHYMMTSDAAVSRLESLDDVPHGPRSRRNRQLACVLCHAYRVDPAEFGLSDDDLPPSVAVSARSGTSSTIWYSHHPRMSELAAAV